MNPNVQRQRRSWVLLSVPGTCSEHQYCCFILPAAIECAIISLCRVHVQRRRLTTAGWQDRSSVAGEGACPPAVNSLGFLAVGVGAALGAWLRWGLSLAFNHTLPNLPLGTLLSNLIGGYLVGVAVELLVHHSVLSPEWRLFIITGFLGGLTTFSTFSAEAVFLLSRHEYAWTALLIGAHVAGSLIMTALGIATVRYLA